MSTASIHHPAVPEARSNERSRMLFAIATLAVIAASGLMAGWAPLGFSITVVFLFAGPHNWLEFRYFLSRMPARWGPRRAFYTSAIAGSVLLSLAFAGLSWCGQAGLLEPSTWRLLHTIWNSSLVLWLTALVYLRHREKPTADPLWIASGSLAALGIVWAVPTHWDLALVYLHPLVAIVFMYREVRRQRREWLPIYVGCLCLIPVVLAILCWRLWDAPDLVGQDALSTRIALQAGSSLLDGVSTHLLVAIHTFLESIHYGVWLLGIPLLAIGSMPWKTNKTPIAKKSAIWRNVVRIVVFGGAIAVVALWACFAANYPTTRDIYFTLAIFHVLVEFTFLIGTV